MAEVGGNEERKRKRWILLAPGNQLLPACHWLAHLHNHHGDDDDDDDDHEDDNEDEDEDDDNGEVSVCQKVIMIQGIWSFSFF